MKNEKKIAIAFLKWTSKYCTPRRTSRDNKWNNYWQRNSTGVLYTNEELFDYWEINAKDNG